MSASASYHRPPPPPHGGRIVGGTSANANTHAAAHNDPSANKHTQYATNVARSMTIQEMRELHRKAQIEAEAKKTELRLVLASRYRELVGSSDEVLHMQTRARELDDLVRALPGLAERLARCAERVPGAEEEKEQEEAEGGAGAGSDDKGGKQDDDARSLGSRKDRIDAARRSLALLPRSVHRCLDRSDVHGAATDLIRLFDLIASRTDAYPLATALSSSSSSLSNKAPTASAAATDGRDDDDLLLQSQMKMTYLHVQTVPDRTVRLARRLLHRAAGSHPSGSAAGARMTASALSALDLLDPTRSSTTEDARAVRLLDLYYDSKARLVQGLLDRLGRNDGADGGGGGGGTATPSKGAGSRTIGGGGAAAEGTSSSSSAAAAMAASDEAADEILGKIVLILQHDVLLHPYQIFVLGRYQPTTEDVWASSEERAVMSSLPRFDGGVLRSKASNFLAVHLPLIRTKVKAVLMNIAGTTAARLGNIRQSLYDKTDGDECMRALDSNGLCTWDEAVGGVVDVRVVSAHGTQLFSPEKEAPSSSGKSSRKHQQQPSTTGSTRRFSLWAALFSTTFSSLVHSILTSSFHSVHAKVIGTLRSSLAAAPPLRSILPHEAHRNALLIATELDLALRKVSDDAHELLVHAEERVESERRLRQSLYVQTCEIIGRLLNELRRMLDASNDDGRNNKTGGGRNKNGMLMITGSSIDRGTSGEEEDATTELIVGRLCHLLKFRLACLPALLDPASSPAAMAAAAGGKSGMISLDELRSSFEIADDDDDGLISVEEAMEAVESAFSGTQFRGAEMVRDTLLLTSSSSGEGGVGVGGGGGGGGGGTGGDGSHQYGHHHHQAEPSSIRNVTLSELVLLSARGLRHDKSGPNSALGTIQRSLDDTVRTCFTKWARVVLAPSMRTFRSALGGGMDTACGTSDVEWRRLHNLLRDDEADELRREILEAVDDNEGGGKDAKTVPPPAVGNVSPHFTAYLLSLAAALNQSVCPSDSLPPVPSVEYAEAVGISLPKSGGGGGVERIPTMMRTIRGSLLKEAVTSIAASLEGCIEATVEGGGDEGGADGPKPRLSLCSASALVQLQLDVTFFAHCFFDRNRDGFTVLTDGTVEAEAKEGEEDSMLKSRRLLDKVAADVSAHFDSNIVGDPTALNDTIHERHLQALGSCDLFLSSLFGEDDSSAALSALSGASSAAALGGIATASAVPTVLLNPLQSSRRFMLLPIQAERSLNELQLRGKYGNDKAEAAEADASTSASASAMSSGFGFFSSMLKKK